MTTYGGVKLPTTPGQGLRPADQDAIRERTDFVNDPQDWMDTAVQGKAGSFTDNFPVAVTHSTFSGGKLRTFFDDYYNRIYFLPVALDFGSISADAAKDFRVWNATLVTVHLTDITLLNGEGLSLSGPDLPDEFLPLGLKTYTAHATTDGPPSLDATFTFTFDKPQITDLHVVGTRAKLSPLLPNWRTSYVVAYEYKSDIKTSRDGHEQRRALRTTPRKKITFEATAHGDAYRTINNLLNTWQNNVIILPELPVQAKMSTGLDVGEVVVNLVEVPRWLVADMTIVINYKGQYETARVDSIGDHLITLASASGRNWPVGTKVHPGVSGRLALSLSSTRETNNAGAVSFEMDVTPASEPEIFPLDATETFNGRELFLMRPNWSTLPAVTYEAHRETLDRGRGRIAVFLPIQYINQTRTMTYTSRDYASMETLIDFYKRQKGQRGEFYMPTWDEDIKLGKPTPAVSRTIRINGSQFASDYVDDTIHKAVRVVYRNGAVQNNVVESIIGISDADGVDSIIQVAEDWTQEITAATVESISWLLVWRHASDTLTVEWLTNTIGQCQMTMMSLEDLA